MVGDVAQAELDMETVNKDIVAKLRLEANPDTYFKDWLDKFQFASRDMLIKAKGEKTKAAIEQALSRITTREARKQKDYANQLLIDTEKAEDIRRLDSYATQEQLEKGLDYLDKRSDLYNPIELERVKSGFKADYDRVQKELVYAEKILKKEKEIKEEEAIEQAHDEQEKAIGEAYKNKDYHKALTLLKQKGNLLTGEEDRVWSNAIESAGKTDTNWEYTDPEIESDIISRLGTMEDDEIRSYMGDGLSISDTLKYLDKNRVLDEDTKKLQTPQYNEAKSFLKLAKDRAIFLPDVDNDEDLTDEEALENRTLYTNALKELERQVLNPKNSKTESEIVNEIMKPYFEKKSNGFWNNIVSFWGGVISDLTSAKEPIEPDDPKRQQAIDLLKGNNKLINEETIKQVMGQL